MGLLSRRDEDFTAFVEQHGDALLRAAHFLTGDRWTAEDLVQLALTKTYLAWPATRGAVSYAYARQALLSCHTDTWRRRRWREDTTAPEDLPGYASSPTAGRADTSPAHCDPAHTVVERDGVEQALARLTPCERAVVVLRYLEDLTEKDTARLLNVSVGTVKTLHSRAMTRLRTNPDGALPSDVPPGGAFRDGVFPNGGLPDGEPPGKSTVGRPSWTSPARSAGGLDALARRTSTPPPLSSSARKGTADVDQ